MNSRQMNKILCRFYLKDFRKYFLSISFLTLFFVISYVAASYLMQLATTKYGLNETNNFLMYFGLTIAGYVLMGLFNLGITQTSNKVAHKIEINLAMTINQKLKTMSISFFEQNKPGELYTKALTDPQIIKNALTTYYEKINVLVIGGIGFGIALLVINPYVVLIALAVYLIVMIPSFVIVKKAYFYKTKTRKVTGEINDYVEELIRTRKTISEFDAQEQFIGKYDEKIDNMKKTWIKSEFLSIIPFPLSVTASCVMGVVIAFSYLLFTIHHVHLPSGFMSNFITQEVSNQLIEVPNFAPLITLSFSSVLCGQYVTDLVQQTPTTLAGKSALVKIYELLSAPSEKDGHEKLRIDATNGIDIQLKDVTFQYNKDVILENISLHIPKNKTTAIIGPTGSGKTTLASLIMRFYDFQKGEIFFNDVAIKDKTRDSVRSYLTSVLQEPYLFKKSIYDNFFMVNKTVTKERIYEVCKMVGIHDTIMQLDDQYNTIMDEKHGLSNGQKQLITIARAMIKDAPVVVLDEATSNVDVHTEQQIQKAMKKLIANKTSIVIAHRLSTIVEADQIVMLNDKKIVAIGRHHDLLKTNESYKKLFNNN
ncbi:ABC transporter ATP-binding protein/permease [Ureaplasma miroungigenitalium]|uniref:ABC transporter ATP-binding protein n=1 Tax=Ureaplasma miroungigenitalium TaxID=1042321 RepID=UPI0021E98778|nr:ABC transporter ATP-binding protein [Ureaplasma miroungigenitalium]MCV3734288.1 ABC transporter ATP-binding protein/permease [Ureaplasma miroungigenitalium]